MRPFEPVHGIDFLIDFYEVLGVGRDANKEQIQGAYREKIKLYHPDLVARAAPEIQRESSAKTRLFTRAYEVLTDPEKKATYDAKLQSFDPELISKKGNALISLRKKRIDVDSLVSGGEWNLKSAALEYINAQIGRDEGVFQIVEEQYKSSKNPSAELREAYKKLLQGKSAHLALLEEVAWADVGVSNQSRPELVQYPEDYLTKRKEQVEQTRTEIGKGVEARVAALASGVTLKSLKAADREYDFEATRQNTLALVSNLTDIAIRNFEAGISKIEELAEQKVKVLEELVQFTRWEYYPQNQSFHNKLLIVVPHEGIIVGEFLYEIKGERATVSSPYEFRGKTLKDFMSQRNMTRLHTLIVSGVNVALLYKDDELDLTLQMTHIATQHCTKLLENKDQNIIF